MLKYFVIISIKDYSHADIYQNFALFEKTIKYFERIKSIMHLKNIKSLFLVQEYMFSNFQFPFINYSIHKLSIHKLLNFLEWLVTWQSSRL